MSRPFWVVWYGVIATCIFLFAVAPLHIFRSSSNQSTGLIEQPQQHQEQELRPPSFLSAVTTEPVDEQIVNLRPSVHDAGHNDPSWHPIDDLVREANEKAANIENPGPIGLSSAAAAYRKRRGRYPPPEFDKWVAFANKTGAIISEEFFDQIYNDLEPFWGIQPSEIRIPEDWAVTLNIRRGKVTVRKNPETRISGDWDDSWVNMLRHLQDFLPDVDMAVNDLDEPRISVPWEKINEYMNSAAKTRRSQEILTMKSTTFVNSYPSLVPPLGGREWLDNLDGVGPRWENPTEFWQTVRSACPPNSAARYADLDRNMSVGPQFQQDFPLGSYHGFVSNWTFSKSVCEHAHLRNELGIFVKPRYNSINTTLFPLFSGCKIQGLNNEILLPAAKYWTKGSHFAFKSRYTPWEDKLDQIIWRGQASGGAHNKTNWKRFHRQRFLAMLNGTEVEREERSQHNQHSSLTPAEPPHNIPLPNATLWDLGALKTVPSTLGRWVKPFADAAFIHFHCHPWRRTVVFPNTHCSYTDPYYSSKDEIPLSTQWQYKYLPDIDGNSYSGRFRAFMQSGSLPIKATIWSEWHDSRLIPWRHFVPMDNTYADWWAILEYLVGYRPEPGMPGKVRQGHDDTAKAIAEQGRDWAARVLRQEDMLVYVYRLILEYARVCSEERERMAFVADLSGER